MIRLTLKHLRYFRALAEHGHFGRAAEACSISQPALSLQIKELEGIIGGSLIDRSARQAQLTSLGEDFRVRAETILVLVEDLEELVRASDGPLSGRLRIGIIPTVAPYLLPGIFRALADRFPALVPQPREQVTEELIADLLSSTLDVAILALPVNEPRLASHALFDEELVLVRPRAERAAPVPSPAELSRMHLLLLEEGNCFRDETLAYCALKGDPARSMVQGRSVSTLVQMVSAGIGVTLIPELAVPFEMSAADVCVSRFPAPRPTRKIGMVWRRTSPLAGQLGLIAEAVREVAEVNLAEAQAVLARRTAA